jgi:Phage Mu protein F like protein
MTFNANEDLIAALSDIIDSMFADYDRSTRDNLRAVLSSKLTQPSGTSLRELTAAVQNIPPFQNREKAETIAKTISFGVSNLANRRAWQRSGVVKTLKWFAAGDADMCGLCAKLSGKVVNVSDCFLTNGDVLTDNNGASIIIVRNIETPPLHEGCRCYCRPDGISSD